MSTVEVPNLGLEIVDSQIWDFFDGHFFDGHFLDRPETFQIAWKLSRSYRHSSRSYKLSLDYLDAFLNYLGTFRIVRKLFRSPRHISRSSRLFLDYLDTFSRLSGHCLDCTETFQIIRTLFGLYGHIF